MILVDGLFAQGVLADEDSPDVALLRRFVDQVLVELMRRPSRRRRCSAVRPLQPVGLLLRPPLGLVGGAELVATCASPPRFGAVFFAVAAGGCGLLLIWSLLSRFGPCGLRARALFLRVRAVIGESVS